MKNPIKTFEPNTVGRDFVIGDLHGSYTAFENLLEKLYFDETKDRMFSVGDLCDRGPNSLACLGLLHEPWFHAVLSNHEQMMLEKFRGGYMGEYWFQNGGHWGMEAWNDSKNLSATNELHRRVPSDDSVRLFELLPLVEELPFIMTIKLTNGKKIHVIHAELPPGYNITDKDLADAKKVMGYATMQSSDGDYFLWGRHLFMDFYRRDLTNEDKIKRIVFNMFRNGNGFFNDKLSHIVSGHTIMQRPITILGQTNIDTCAYGSYRDDAKEYEALTCIELNTWTFYQATDSGFRTVNPLVVNTADIDALRELAKPAGSVLNSGLGDLSEGIELLSKRNLA